MMVVTAAALPIYHVVFERATVTKKLTVKVTSSVGRTTANKFREHSNGLMTAALHNKCAYKIIFHQLEVIRYNFNKKIEFYQFFVSVDS